MFVPRYLLISLPVLVSFFGASMHGQSSQTEMIRVTSRHVVVDVRVIDRKTGQTVPGLTADDFEIYESGIRQEITHCSRDRLPISAILLLDVSGSMQGVIDQLRKNALQALQRLKPEDEVALIAYGMFAQLIQDFTKDRELVAAKIGSVNEVSLVPRGTAVSEAIFQAAVHMAHAGNPASRRVIVVITDDVSQEDQFIRDSGEALEQLLESATSLYGVTVLTHQRVVADQLRRRIEEQQTTIVDPGQFGRPLPTRSIPLPRYTQLQEFAEPTGGEVFSTGFESVTEKLGGLLDRIRDAYSLGYTPSNPKADARFREIRVRLKRKVVDETTGKEIKTAIITRRGYYPGGHAPQAPGKQAKTHSLALNLSGRPETVMAHTLYVTGDVDGFATSIVAPLFLDPHGKVLARVTVWIDPAGVRLTRADDRYGAVFKLLAAVFNQTRMIVADYWNDFRLDFDDEQYRQFLVAGSSLSLSFTLSSGNYMVRTVLRDSNSEKVSSRRVPLEVLPLSKDVPFLSSLVLSTITVAANDAGGAEVDYDPLRLAEAKIVPSFAESYSPDGLLTVFFHIYNVRDHEGARYQYRLSLYREKVPVMRGEPRPVESENLHPMQGYLLAPRLDLSGLMPGDYEVEVEVALPDGSNRVSRSAPVKVEKQPRKKEQQ